MKTITGIAIAALMTASVNVASAGCGQCAADRNHAQHDHPESLAADHQHPNRLTQCAIALFSELGTDRGPLAAKAEGGCETSATALIEDEIKAVEAMLAAMEDQQSRRILRLGMMLQEWTANPGADAEPAEPAGAVPATAPDNGDTFDIALDDIREQLEAQLAQYRASTVENGVEN